MPDIERLQLPLRPSGNTLAAHIAALDLLAARLDALATRSRWAARVPLNLKASFEGDIVHTNEVKINVGGDLWIEMTAHEAADWTALLEEHARATEGQTVQPKSEEEPTAGPGQRVLRTKDITFDPLLGNPPHLAQPQQTPQAQQQQTTSTRAKAPSNATHTSALVHNGKEVDVPQSLQSLVDLVGEHLQDKLSIPNGDSTVNESGEPIYEIREDVDGRSLAPLPDASGEGTIEMPEDERAEYFSPEAVERRAALRRRIFHEGSDDDDEDMDVDTDQKDEMDVDDAETPKASQMPAAFPTPAPQAPPQPSPQPSFQSTIDAVQLNDLISPTTPTQPSLASFPASPARGPPKGILKQPVRKKSVSFDQSVPIPPDTPPPRRQGFPLDQMIASTRPVDAHGLPAKQVPILKAPFPGRRSQPETFGGLRTGFLSSAPILSLAPQVESSRTAMTQPEPRQPSPLELARKAEEKAPAKLKVEEKPVEKTAAAMKVEEKPTEEDEDVKEKAMDVDEPQSEIQKTVEIPKATKAQKTDAAPKTEEAPKKKSLFAQRRAPNFPKQSETPPMVTMKGAVVEAPPAPKQTGVPPTVGSSETPMVIVDDDDDDDDDEDYGDLGDFSEDEEDEYALDEALLAREVALEYHRRQAWQRPIDEDEIDPEAEGAEAVLGIPRVSTISGQGEDLRIVNPTADDLSQFLRVGRADDGELVFEPPLVHSDSESDGEDDSPAAVDRRQRRARRKDVMARLLRGEYEELPTAAADPGLRAEQYRESLPPSVGKTPEPQIEEINEPAAAPAASTPTASTPAASTPAASTPAPTAPKQPPPTRDVVERSAAEAPSAPTPPKKVSRFKAARMQS
ncbi:hypothetical protein CC85DRAFT_328596 [Cutaneotrichosporon oleaginosum]|uniref:DUF3835 domain-containing protein n=1 Tax=Cutaneotrichosporon oleaginosum TaxID=879819 RepID=A0A0J0XLU5_9TREE|nr:uncharacterized protein CC85DRAFT_328596 [Cutaneotrichosporon oleaginosum]KLT42038.1 hypothetical protein CC85DRAFT_328596 [Cutaneotrichosporon oleaginosum]TXT14306.1 hypothetical protein COLE_00499 [Cutaneotrichosporon oleaginosum]